MMRNLLFLVPFMIVSSSQAQSPRVAAGEVMARFAQGSEGGGAVARAMQANPQDLSGLTPAVTALGAKVGVPLRAKQLGSGSWLVLAVDSTVLMGRVEGQLEARENVENVSWRDEAPRLLVRFASGSAESRATAQQLAGAADELERLVWSLEREVGLPLVAEAVGRQELALGVDVNALTVSVSARLQALPEIESAQPNYILRRM